MDEIRIGSCVLQPGRQLAAHGERVPLGKRALDILSALAAAKGEIVTKDELLAAVWPGAIVEENALQVHMVALRRALGCEAERLKTIRGVGYQLRIDDGLVGPDGPQPNPRAERPSELEQPLLAGNGRTAPLLPRPWRRRAAAIALASGILVVGVGAAALWPGAPAPAQESVRIEPLASAGGEPARLLALTLHDNVIQVFNQSRLAIASSRRAGLFSDAANASQLLRGTVAQSGGRLHVDMFIDDAASGTTLWSKQFDGDAASPDKLSTEAAVAAARTIFTIRELDTQRNLKLDPETVALFIRGEDLLRSNQVLDEGAPRETFEQLVARSPRSAPGHASLAMAFAAEARRPASGPLAPLLAKGRSEARTAIAIHPFAAGAAYDALYTMARIEHPRQIAAGEDWLLEGLQKAPQFAFLWMRECRVLIDVGRARDAIPMCQRALALHPFAEPIGHTYALALSEAGDDQQAVEAIERSASYSPEHLVTRQMRFELAAFGGRPGDALRLIENPATRPVELRRAETDALVRYLKDAGKWTPQERRDLSATITGLALHGDMAVDLAVTSLVSLGHLDEAFEVLRSPHVDGALYGHGIGFLFEPVSAPLRADPRFWTMAADLGLAQYWTARQQWPDMCGDQVSLQFCKAQTARALAAA